MIGRLAVVSAWCLAAAPASAGSAAPWTRASAAVNEATGADLPFFPSARFNAQPAATPASVVAPDLWSRLPAPPPAYAAWLRQRVPGLDVSAVRTLSSAEADVMLAAAVAQKLTPLDFFTDSAFRGRQVFFIPQDVLKGVFARWELKVFTPYEGVTDNGSRFTMQGMLMGGGKLEILYDQMKFTFVNPVLDNGKYTLLSRVTERINGPGDLSIEGVEYHYKGPIKPDIKRIYKLSPSMTRVETSLGGTDKPADPIRRL